VLSARTISYRRPPRVKPIEIHFDDEFDSLSTCILHFFVDLNRNEILLLIKFIQQLDLKAVVYRFLVYRHLKLGQFLVFIVQLLPLMNKQRKIMKLVEP